MPRMNCFGLGIAVVVVFVFTLMSAQALMIAPSSKIIYVPDNYSTIQQAVDAASPGDTIIVRDGIYIENIKISKSYLTIKSENGSTNCIVQAADSKDSVFRVSNANYINIIGFTLKSSTEAVHDGGLSLRGAHYCNISCNIILNNRIGISMWSSSNIEINNNIIKSNSYFGIYLHTSDYNTIINNFIESNGQQGIYLSSSGQNILKDNALLNNGIGVHIASVGGNILINNRISGNNYGIYLIDTPSNNLTKNDISNNNYGVYLNGRGGNIFTENNILENGYGVYLDFANHNFFYFNNMMNNTHNIYTHDSNNLWNSTEQIAYTYKGKTYANFLGNYWSDHECEDSNGDGICDSPYVIDSDNQDNYPLAKSFENYQIGEGIPNQPPKASFTFSPKNPLVNEEITFNASASTDPDGSIVSYEWDFGDGETASGKVVTHAYSDAGSYTVTLTVTDDDAATHSISKKVNVTTQWSFAIITDLHIGYGIPDFGTDGWNDTLTGNPALDNYYLTKRLEAVVDWINNHIDDYNIKFVAVLGDITDTAEKSEFIKAKEILDKLDVPYFPIIGNHDVCPYIQQAGHHPDYRIRYGEQGEISREHFRNIFTNDFFKTQANELGVVINFQSEDPNDLLNYAFTYGGIKFIFLDFASDEYAAGYHSGIEGEAKLFDENLDWLREQTSGSTPVVLFSHYPMATFRGVSPYFHLTDMHPTITFALRSGAFSVGEITAIGKELLGKKILANFAGHIHSCSLGGLIPMEFNANRVYGYLCGAPVISTEAILAESSEVVRIVQIEGDSITNYNILKPEKGELTSAINPWITFNPKNIGVGTEVEFEAGAKPWLFGISYEWDLDGDGETDSTDDDPEFVYSEPGTYYVFLTIEDDGNRETVWQRITVHPHQIPAWVIEAGVEAAELYFTLAFEEDVDLTEVAQNTFELVRVFVRHSEARPVAEMAIHFENATEDINLTNLIADTNITQRKSILYMPEWPEVVEKSKVLYIPSTGKGAVYICKNATSLDEVNLENADVIINVGETKDGMTVLTTYYNGREYYMVLNVTGTGGGECEVPTPVPEFTSIGLIMCAVGIFLMYVLLRRRE